MVDQQVENSFTYVYSCMGLAKYVVGTERRIQEILLTSVYGSDNDIDNKVDHEYARRIKRRVCVTHAI